MSWHLLRVAKDRSHHTRPDGTPAYAARFDDVLKFHEPGLAPVAKSGEAWHILADGSAAYGHRYQRTFGFYGGLAAVAGEDGWCHVSREGRPVYAARYAWCGNFQGGRCPVRAPDGTYFHIERGGTPAYAQRWRYAGDYRDDVAVVQAADGRSTHIDAQGRLLHGRWFVDLDVFHKGYARARDDDGWMHVSEDGLPAYSRRFGAVEPFYNGQARVERSDGSLEVIDESGAGVLELRPPRRSLFSQLSGDMVGFWKTQAIGAAVGLGVIGALPADASEVAERCGLKPEGARRLLRALRELGLAARSGGRWELSPRGELLRSDHPLTLSDAALEYAGPFSGMWVGLPEAVRADSAWRPPDVFGEVARDEARREGHHRMLRSYARHDYADLACALELKDGCRVVDAGGGLGTLAELVVGSCPTATVTVVDRPEVVEIGRRGSECAGVAWQEADIFEPWPLDADVVLMSRVLHDWDDEAACRILRHARGALSPGGRVCIIEMLIPEGSAAGALCDLHLLMATGGKERSVRDFQRLLDATGFELEDVRTIAALPSIVVGVAR